MFMLAAVELCILLRYLLRNVGCICRQIEKETLLILYAGFILFYLSKFYSTIISTSYYLLLISFVFFLISILFDLINPSISYAYLFEDGSKLIGIISWLVYFFHVGIKINKHSQSDLTGEHIIH